MFDQILSLVKEHLSSDPQVSAAVPEDKKDAVHNEIATQISNGLQEQKSGGGGGLLENLAGGLGGGSMLSGLLEGNAISGLASKLGLPAAATSAISAALPGLLQKIIAKFGGGAASALGGLGGLKF